REGQRDEFQGQEGVHLLLPCLIFRYQFYDDVCDDEKSGGDNRGEQIQPVAYDLDAGVDHPENEQDD
ncbi:MAG: hypothetical protein PHU23_14305, partial [Dehalococcoidales bacterium]|nr:hypothetical protein [Dehalococcoidales bacterium]